MCWSQRAQVWSPCHGQSWVFKPKVLSPQIPGNLEVTELSSCNQGWRTEALIKKIKVLLHKSKPSHAHPSSKRWWTRGGIPTTPVLVLGVNPLNPRLGEEQLHLLRELLLHFWGSHSFSASHTSGSILCVSPHWDQPGTLIFRSFLHDPHGSLPTREFSDSVILWLVLLSLDEVSGDKALSYFHPCLLLVTQVAVRPSVPTSDPALSPKWLQKHNVLPPHTRTDGFEVLLPFFWFLPCVLVWVCCSFSLLFCLDKPFPGTVFFVNPVGEGQLFFYAFHSILFLFPGTAPIWNLHVFEAEIND